MADYIDRETVINHLDACMDTLWKPEIVALKCFVEGVPAADVAPVRYGLWEWDTEDIYRCTFCGNKAHVKEVMGYPEWNYCPNCGARMDGAE